MNRRLLAMVCVLVAVTRSAGDAIVVTRAMQASTVAEVFITEGDVRVTLEIGVTDVEAFGNLLPDALHGEIGLGDEPLAERLPRFFAADLVIRADGGDPIAGELLRIEVRRRVKRDEITGEPIGDSDDGEIIVFAELAYPLPMRPRSLSVTPPLQRGTANIGFMTWHEGLPVMDFRYLAGQETLDLDWDDPWYSKFRNRNLHRQFAAPLLGFLYVDPFEVRKEIVVRPRDLQLWIDLGLDDADVIPVADQAAVKARAAEFLGGRCPVVIDGREIEPVLDRIHFIRRTLRTTGVIDPPMDLPAISATLGVIFAYPVPGLPREVTMTWDLFSDRIDRVPVVATDEAGGLPSLVTPDDPVLTWKNFLTRPTTTALVEIAAPPRGVSLIVPVLGVLSVMVALALVIRMIKTPSPVALLGTVVLLAASLLLWRGSRTAGEIPEAAAGEIMTGLLRNVYRAFDYRDEGDIYDTLDRSASGDLLTRIYLETRRALELENQGGARVKVTGVELVSSTTSPLDGEAGFESRCTWNVAGSVGHWGHIHQRRNRYEAVFTVKPVDGVWKITELELLGEQRL